MAIDVTVSRSPGWWLSRLARKLEARQTRLDLLDRYLRGDPPLPEGAESARKAYISIQKKARLNLAELAVEAVLDRMVPTGFQIGAEDKAGDAKVRKIWTANSLDVESTEVHRLMLALGDSYTIIGAPDAETGVPVITAEDPRQVVTFHDPAQQAKIRAGAKFFHDAEFEQDFAYLYLPGRVFVAFREARHAASNPTVRFSSSAWDWDSTRGGEAGLALPDGNENVMPLVRFRNKRGVGQFETHLDLLDRVNHMILQRMVIATFQAFKQRGIKVNPEDMPAKDPQTGATIDYDEIFSADPGALWQLPQTAEMWESGAVDLQPILSATKEDKMDFAALTRTPLYWFIPDAANGSAEGAAVQREGSVNQAEDRIRRASAGWNRTMATALRFMGDTKRAALPSLRTMWQPANRYSLAERADAGSKAQDIPWETRMTDIWQFPPEKLEEMKLQRIADAELATPPAPPEPVVPEPAPEPEPAPVLPGS